VLQPALTAAVLSRIGALEVELGEPIDPAAAQALAKDWAAEYTPKLIKGLTETTAANVKDVVTAYTAGVITRDTLNAALVPSFGRMRADMIATTETTRANAQATVGYSEYLTKQGLAMEYVWRTNNDEHECSICKPKNDTVVEADFPPAHPRCRCMLTTRLKR
jgi:hypothetical protein